MSIHAEYDRRLRLLRRLCCHLASLNTCCALTMAGSARRQTRYELGALHSACVSHISRLTKGRTRQDCAELEGGHVLERTADYSIFERDMTMKI